jgi:hypothetical protein
MTQVRVVDEARSNGAADGGACATEALSFKMGIGALGRNVVEAVRIMESLFT